MTGNIRHKKLNLTKIKQEAQNSRMRGNRINVTHRKDRRTRQGHIEVQRWNRWRN